MPILNAMLQRIFSPSTMLTLMGEGMLQRIVENSDQPLLERTEKGYGLENTATYDTTTSFTDLCRQGQAGRWPSG